MKKYLHGTLFVLVASLSFHVFAMPKLSCTYKWVNGEVKVIKCCDDSGTCQDM